MYKYSISHTDLNEEGKTKGQSSDKTINVKPTVVVWLLHWVKLETHSLFLTRNMQNAVPVQRTLWYSLELQLCSSHCVKEITKQQMISQHNYILWESHYMFQVA